MLIPAIVTAATLAFGQGSTSGIQMRTVRYWLGDTQKKTSVFATVDVPYALASPVGNGAASFIAYQVRITIKDDKGGILNDQKWERHAPAAMRVENATGLEELKFGVVPGKYWLQVEVTDSATSRMTRDSIQFDGYTSSPNVSDLLVATRLRKTTPGDTTVDAGEQSRGIYRFSTAPTLHIDINSPVLGFLMEVYTPDSANAALALTVTNPDGSNPIPLVPVQKSIPAGGGVLANEFSLDGLPAGSYLLKASVTLKGKTFERTAPFAMNAVEPALQQGVAATNANRGIDEVYFNSLPEDSLDAAAEELELVPEVSRRELAPYKKDELSLRAKRTFLIEFWAKRDPVKATPENEARIMFYDKVNYANAHFGVRFTAGWKTARGRVYAAYGPADDSTSNPMGGRGIRYLVWRYTHGKVRYFIFGDRSNTGNYVILRSSEQQFSGTPGWRSLVTADAVQDIARWLGLPDTYFNNDN